MIKSRLFTLWPLVLALTVYVALYFRYSKVYHCQLGIDQMTLRVFKRSSAMWVCSPLLKIEQALRREEFYGHIANGASLPPAAP
jgi:hypothetical protein